MDLTLTRFATGIFLGLIAVAVSLRVDAAHRIHKRQPAAPRPVQAEAIETIAITDTGLAETAGAALALFETEGTGINILGVNRVQTLLDGRQVFTVRNGHALSWQDVSREWMHGVQVRKVADPGMIEGGLGGTVTIETRKPLDEPHGLTAFAAGTIYSDLADNATPRLSLLHSRKADTAIGGVGLLVNVLSQEQAQRSDVVFLEPFHQRDDLGQKVRFVPRGFGWRQQGHEQDQLSWSAVLQWQPNRAWRWTGRTLRSANDRHTVEYNVGLKDTEHALVPAPGTAFIADEEGIFQAGALRSNAYRGNEPGDGIRLNGITRTEARANFTRENSLEFAYAPDSRWAVRGDWQDLRATTRTLDFSVYTSRYLPDLWLDLRGDLPAASPGPQDTLLNQQGYFWNAAMDHHEDGRARLRALRLDTVLDLSDQPGLSSLQAGLRLSREASHIVDAGYNWGSISDIWNEPRQYLQDKRPDLAELIQIDDFFRNESGVPAHFWLPAASFVGDFPAASAILVNDIKDSPDGHWQPDTMTPQDHNLLVRDTAAAYLMLKFNGHVGPFPARGQIGARHVTSEVQAEGFEQFRRIDDDEGLDPSEIAFAGGNHVRAIEHGRYSRWLPGAHLNLKLTSKLLWRMAVSRNIAPPDFNDMRSYLIVQGETETLGNGSATRRVKRWYAESGNPLLHPIRSNQLDTALEWQFSASGRVHTALFYKHMEDSFERQVVLQTLTNQDQSRVVEVEKLVNGNDATLQGYELGLRQKLGFLSENLRNIAFEALYTNLQSDSRIESVGRTLPLEGLARNNWKLSGTWQSDRWRTTFNYHWRDDYLQSTIDLDTNRPTWRGGAGRLDASITLILNSNLQLALEGHNLGNRRDETLLGPYTADDGRPDPHLYHGNWTVQDRQWRLMLRGRF